MSSNLQSNNDIQRYLSRPSSKERELPYSTSGSKLNFITPEGTTRQRQKNIQLLQNKIQDLKHNNVENMQEHMLQQQQILSQAEKLQVFQKQKTQRPTPLSLGQEQFILQNNYLNASQTGKLTFLSPLEAEAELKQEMNKRNQIQSKEPTPSHITQEFLRDKLEFFSRRLKDSSADFPATELNSQQSKQIKKQNANKYDINQHSSGNMPKLIRESRGQNNGQQIFKNSRNSVQANYDLNGRKKSKMLTQQQNSITDTGELIENHYQKLQQSYNEIFKSQHDYRNNMKNQQIINHHRHSSQKELQEIKRQNDILPDIKSIRKMGLQSNALSNDVTQSQSSNQQAAVTNNTVERMKQSTAIPNNQPSPHRANPNSILQRRPQHCYQFFTHLVIMPQAPPPIGYLSPQEQQNQDLKTREEQQINIQTSQQEINNLRMDPQRRGKRNPSHEDYMHEEFRTRKSISPELQNADGKLDGQRYVDRRRSHANFSGHSNNLRSISDKISSNDPESIERQNNQMLMQILYNNLKKNQGRYGNKKVEKKQYAPSSSYDMGNKLRVSKTNSQSTRGLVSKRNHSPLERKQAILVSPSSKDESEVGGSQESKKKIANFSSYVKEKLIQSENKSQSPKDIVSSQKKQNLDIQDIQVVQETEFIKGTKVNHNVRHISQREKNVRQAQSNHEAQQLREASQKIQKVMNENNMFGGVDCQQITNTMMHLLAESKKNVKFDTTPQQLDKKQTGGGRRRQRVDQNSESNHTPDHSPISRDENNQFASRRSSVKKEPKDEHKKPREDIKKQLREEARKIREEVRKSREEAAPKKLGEESVKKVKSVNKKVDGSKLKPLQFHHGILKDQITDQKTAPNIVSKTIVIKEIKGGGEMLKPQTPKSIKNIQSEKVERSKNISSVETKLIEPENRIKQSSSGNTVKTTQFPAKIETKIKKARFSSGQSPRRSDTDLIESKLEPPMSGPYVHIKEESKYNCSSSNTQSQQINSYFQGEFQENGDLSKIDFIEQRENTEIKLSTNLQERQEVPKQSNNIQQVVNQVIVEKPKVKEPAVAVTPVTNSKKQKQTELKIINEEPLESAQVGEEPSPSPAKEKKDHQQQMRRNSKNSQSQKTNSKSAKPKKTDKFSQSLIDAIDLMESSKFGKTQFAAKNKAKFQDYSQMLAQQQPKLLLSKRPGLEQFQEQPKLINLLRSSQEASALHFQKRASLLQGNSLTSPKENKDQTEQDSKNSTLEESQDLICVSANQHINQFILDGLFGFEQIKIENDLYTQFKSQMEEFYSQAKQRYQLALRKFQTEKKLMSLSLGKTRQLMGNLLEEDKEAQEVQAINMLFKDECHKLNSQLIIFKLDYETYKNRFSEEININENSEGTQIDSSRLGTTRKNSQNPDWQKKQSFAEMSQTNLNNDSPIVCNSGRTNVSRCHVSPRVQKSGRCSPVESNADVDGKSQMISDAKSNYQYLYSDSIRSTNSDSSHSKKCKYIQTIILTLRQIQYYEDEVFLQLQLKKFFGAAAEKQLYSPRSQKEKQLKLIKQVSNGAIFLVNQQKQLQKYQQYNIDKQNVNELIRQYYEEQFCIQYPGKDPYVKDEYQRTLSDSNSDSESQLLGSTISSFSQFSTQSFYSEQTDDIYPQLQPQQISSAWMPITFQNMKYNQNYDKKRSSLQDMFQYAQISNQMVNELTPYKRKRGGPNDFLVDEEVIEESSLSHSRIVNIKSVISLHTNTYQDSIQENSDDHDYQQNLYKGFDTAPNYEVHTKFGESDRRNNSIENREQLVKPDHIDKPYFFNQQSLAIHKYEKVQAFELNHTLDQYDIKSVNFFLNKINEIWLNKARKNIIQKKISQAQLSKVQQTFKKMVRKLQKQKYSETSIINVLQKFKLTHLVNEMIFATQNYQEWLYKRLNGYCNKALKKNSRKLQEWNNENFWSGKQLLLKKFLQQNQIKLQQDHPSISSECDGEEYNNTDCIQMMHEGINPNLLLKNVVKEKNMQYEIFIILSQTKMNKCKNKIMEDRHVGINEKIGMIDQRFKWIQNQARIKYMKARNLQHCPQELIELLHKSEHSSEIQSDDSIEQTAKYFFIEDLELQANKRKMQIEFNRKKQLGASNDKSTEKNNSSFKFNSRSGYSFGFRYGNCKKTKSCNQKEQPVEMLRIGSPHQTQKQRKKEAGHVRLVNGCALSLEDEDNIFNKYGNQLNFKQKAKAEKDILRIQDYYNFVKDHLKNQSKQDKIIIRYKRQQVLREDQIDEDNQTALKQFLTHKNSRIVQLMKNKKAIHYDLTTQTIKRYTNPFEISRFIKSDNIINFMSQLKKKPELKKEKQIHIKSKKFFTADSNQADGVEDFLKTPDYKQGNKCDFFVFKCKLQSIGDYTDLTRLEQEMQLSNQYPKDVMQYKNIIEADSGYPIFMLFEVLHVSRKTVQDVQEDQINALNMIRHITGNQESEKISHLVQKMKEKQVQVNNVDL